MVPSKVRGTQDKLNLKLQNSLVQTIEAQLLLANFVPAETPILEKLDLFKSAVGSETDVVSKEMFLVHSGEDDQICLRPEMTASFFRAFLENRSELPSPWKAFATGPCFRHERPQKGRFRQFDQVNIETIDIKSELFDVELLTVLDRLFSHTLQIPAYSLKINYLGTDQDRVSFRKQFDLFLENNFEKICTTCQTRAKKNPLRCFDCKNNSCILIFTQAPKITESLSAESKEKFSSIKKSLELSCVNFDEDHSLVRGLDYYQGLVFEFSTDLGLGSQTAFAGGGRYELATRLKLKDEVLAVGAGIGVARLLMVLEETQKVTIKNDAVGIIPMSDAQEMFCLLLATHLRSEQIPCSVILDKNSIKSKIKAAEKSCGNLVLFVGEDEVNNNFVTIKNLVDGASEKIAQQDLVAKLKNV